MSGRLHRYKPDGVNRSGADAAGRHQEVGAWRLAEGVAAHAQGRIGDAARFYQDVLGLDPLNADALNLLGLAHMQAGDHRGAGAFLIRALVVDPGFADALNHFALSLLRTGRQIPALRMLLRAIAVRRDFVEAHANCGSALAELGERARAVASYDRALALRPDYADAHANRANALQLLGRLDEARPGYERALALRLRRGAQQSGDAGPDRRRARRRHSPLSPGADSPSGALAALEPVVLPVL